MRRVFTPDTESQLAFLVSLLEAHGISTFVHNAGFGSLFPGVQIEHYNRRSIMVAEDDAEEAVRLIDNALSDAGKSEGEKPRESKGLLRMVLELVLFGWFVPGSRPRGTDQVKTKQDDASG